ncbi:tRNA (adenosine(37)-N6)-dimethylallyltransferase MiaA [Leptolyngbya sp. CCY15150]|uniref:tRNA (adenosine(37)-N6)-dimethylallyltransferase MiaA n=1 Tax=Leptolyngbya sp. CCY15150 TaxID=2767772 RepID=UPI00194E09B5|nr:tRNA (adenosine(37)-N6)-dimethylallyltransferase MiaA [Leptolyngbya sp. CCY15150]
MLIVVCGPTATGKSGLAVELAQRLQSCIINADSRQVYRELDIGTAKPSKADQMQVPHHLLDICDPTETLTLAGYQERATTVIDQIHRSTRGWARVPLLVGGSGLYIKAIVNGLLIPRVAPNPELRSQLQALGQSQCYAMLRQVDAIAGQRIHAHDKTRTIRALEVFYTTGIPLSSQQGEQPPTYPIYQIGLDCLADSDRLQQRIEQRTAQMLEQGLVEEVAGLCDRYGRDLPLLSTLGYQDIKDYLAGTTSLPEAEQLIALHTRQFAKRQRTWFRADQRIHWFDSDAPDLIDQVWRDLQVHFLDHAKDLESVHLEPVNG